LLIRLGGDALPGNCTIRRCLTNSHKTSGVACYNSPEVEQVEIELRATASTTECTAARHNAVMAISGETVAATLRLYTAINTHYVTNCCQQRRAVVVCDRISAYSDFKKTWMSLLVILVNLKQSRCRRGAIGRRRRRNAKI